MHKLKKLQERYKKGELTKAQYQEEVKKLLEGEYIDQEENDEALNFDPEADKPIYTQADVDGFIVKKATAMVRKALKDAGVEVDAANKDLMAKVVELAKTGQAGDGKATDKDLEKLKALEAKLPGLEGKVKDLTITNAVLATAGKLNPINPSQVVRALRMDYMDLVEIDDETGEVDTKTVEKALKRIKDAEPNLFKTVDGGEGDEGDDDNGGAGEGFKSKAPGGSGTGGSKKDKDYAAKKAKALEMLGITQDKK